MEYNYHDENWLLRLTLSELGQVLRNMVYCQNRFGKEVELLDNTNYMQKQKLVFTS